MVVVLWQETQTKYTGRAVSCIVTLLAQCVAKDVPVIIGVAVQCLASVAG